MPAPAAARRGRTLRDMVAALAPPALATQRGHKGRTSSPTRPLRSRMCCTRLRPISKELRVLVLSALGDTGGVAGGEKGESVHGLQPQSREQGAPDPKPESPNLKL